MKIKEDVGTFWRDLGIKLQIDQAKLRNLQTDYRFCSERADQLLLIWMDQNGNDATVGRLACTLISMGQKRTADKLLGMYVSLFEIFVKKNSANPTREESWFNG